MATESKCKGQKKIAMKKISNKNHLQVTFSKRRAGLFKKASEICTLCNAEVALVVFSPTDKVFSFGHPNVEALIDHYLKSASPEENPSVAQFNEAYMSASVRELNVELSALKDEIEVLRKNNEELSSMRNQGQVLYWWQSPIEEMNEEQQLQKLKMALEEIKKDANNRIEMLSQIMNNPPTQTAQVFQ